MLPFTFHLGYVSIAFSLSGPPGALLSALQVHLRGFEPTTLHPPIYYRLEITVSKKPSLIS